MTWTTYWENKSKLSSELAIMNKHNDYTDWLKDKNLSKNTIRSYLNALERFQQDFTNENLKEYFRSNKSKYEANSLRVLKHCLNSYIKFKELKIDWEKIARIIPKMQRKFFDTIDEKELAMLEKARVEKNEQIWERNNLIMRFLLYSGVRINELTNLKHSDWQNNQLRVHGKGNKIRFTFLPPFLIDQFNPNSYDYLFTNQRGKQIKAEYIRWLLKARTKQAELNKKITPHTFRRSFATMLYKNGTQLLTIQKLLGHSSVQTTETYIQNDFAYAYADYSRLWMNKKVSQDKQLVINGSPN